MSDVSNILDFPGQINTIRAEIVTHSNNSVDISAMIIDLTLYEDIFSNTMSGYVFIEDSLDLISSLPLVGQEIFLLELQTPTFREKIDKKFYVYKLSSRSTKKRSQSYMLHFCSLELIVSINSKVSKAFAGNITDIVTDIFNNDRLLASKEILKIDKTSNSINFISPYWTPLQSINWLAEKSINERGVSNYLFYETNKTFEFSSIDTLMRSGNVMNYIFADVDSKTAAPNDFLKQYEIVESIDTDVVFDYMRNTSAGMYGSTLYTYDITTKTIAKTTYDYFNSFDKSTHLEPYPLRTPELARKSIASVHHIAKNNYRTGSNKPLRYGDFFLQRNSLIEQITAFKFNIRVFGRTDIKVGDVVSFTISDKRQITKSDIEEAKSDYFSGRYLIAAIRHQISYGKHFMNMEIVSDSFIKELT